MKDLKLKIFIDKPVAEVFEFATNPNNTHLWVPNISKEVTNEWPVKIGTIYKNTSDGVGWSEYVVSRFEVNKIFKFDKIGSTYHVQYTFVPQPDNRTELVYYEWMDEGELDGPFTMDILKKLKQIIEQK